MDTLNAAATWDRLGSIAQLLHQAAAQVWSDADEAAPDSPLHDLGLGVYLAHSQASALLPDDYELRDVDPPSAAAQPDLVHGSQLVVDLCDLIREARGLDYSASWILDAILAADRARPMLTVLDGHPHTLAFLAGINRVPSQHLGVTRFGQSGDLQYVYRYHGIDTDSIFTAGLDLV